MELPKFVEKSGKMTREAVMSAVALYCMYQYAATAKEIIKGKIARRSIERE